MFPRWQLAYLSALVSVVGTAENEVTNAVAETTAVALVSGAEAGLRSDADPKIKIIRRTPSAELFVWVDGLYWPITHINNSTTRASDANRSLCDRKRACSVVGLSFIGHDMFAGECAASIHKPALITGCKAIA